MALIQPCSALRETCWLSSVMWTETNNCCLP